MYGEKIPPAVAKVLGAKALEAFGLLKLIGPLCRRAASLTEAEADLLQQTVQSAYHVLSEATQAYYASYKVQSDQRAARKNTVAKANGQTPSPGGLWESEAPDE